MTDAAVADAPSVGRRGAPKESNIATVTEVRDKLSNAGAAILTEYRGLTVAELQTLRRALRAAGGEYRIYKNTLVRFATRELGLDGMEELLEGPTAIAFADADVPGVARALREFSRTQPLLVVKGGVMGTSVLSQRDAAALADIPSREVLLARLAGLMAAPMQQFAGLLQALPRNFAYGLKALVDQGGAPGAPADAPAETAAPAAEATPTAEAAPAPAETADAPEAATEDTAAAAEAAPAAEEATPATPQDDAPADAEAAAPADAEAAAPADAVAADTAASTDQPTTDATDEGAE